MRAVITGTDYIKDIDGSFKAIETNTNVGLSVDVSRYLDIDSFKQFVSDNGFEEIVIIYSDTNFQIFEPPTELEPQNTDYKQYHSLLTLLKSEYSGSSVSVISQKVEETSVTIPDVDDSENKLIIRLAFDTTALIDDTYARDNWEFIKLMHDTDPNSIAKTFINDAELGVDSIGSTLRDNGNHPNYCIKKRITPTDNNIYPKLYKINSIEELDALKSQLDADEYIQEYIFNPNDLLNNKVKVYRSVDMVYGGDLDIMNLWVMEHTAVIDTIETPDYDDNNQVQIWDRIRYTTKYNGKTSEIAIKFSADEDTKILDTNNQIVKVQDLNINDLVKSVSVPGMINGTNTAQTLSWSGSTDIIIAESTITQSQLISKVDKDYFGEIIEFELENGSIFSDVPHAKILVEPESNVAKFESYSDLKIGDTILVWDNQTDTIVKQNIVDIRYSFQKLKAYTLNVEEFDLFLTLEEGEENRYGLLTHNYNYDCKNVNCGWQTLAQNIKFCNTGASTSPCAFVSMCARIYTTAWNDTGASQSCYVWFYNWCVPSGTQSFGSFCNNLKPSDTTLKENIKFLYKTKDGLDVYQFSFIDKIKQLWKEETGEDLNGVWKGIMAQELIGTQWESALSKHKEGFYIVDYNKLPKID